MHCSTYFTSVDSLAFTTNLVEDIVIISMLQLRKQRHRKIKSLVQGHTTSLWISWNFRPRKSGSGICAFNEYSHYYI